MFKDGAIDGIGLRDFSLSAGSCPEDFVAKQRMMRGAWIWL